MTTIHPLNQTNQVEKEAGEEQPGAASGTCETWSKTSAHAADTARPGSLNADPELDYPDVRMSVYQGKSLERVDIFTLCCVLVCCWGELVRAGGMQRCWNVRLVMCVSQPELYPWVYCRRHISLKKKSLNWKNQVPICIYCWLQVHKISVTCTDITLNTFSHLKKGY